MNYKGMTGLISGASVAEDKLNTSAESLGNERKIDFTVVPADLFSAESVQSRVDRGNSRPSKIGRLVNNAGLTLFEDFFDTFLEKQMEQVDVNIRAVVTFSNASAPGTIAARRGGVIHIASAVTFQRLAGADVYAAAKAFVMLSSEGLSLELARTNAKVFAGANLQYACVLGNL